MSTIKRITPINEYLISKLVPLARADNQQTDTDIARWIIARSAYWKSKGYAEIMAEIKALSNSDQDVTL